MQGTSAVVEERARLRRQLGLRDDALVILVVGQPEGAAEVRGRAHDLATPRVGDARLTQSLSFVAARPPDCRRDSS